MAGDEIGEVRNRILIEDLIRDYNIRLLPSGKRFLALCPFHREKTPSFNVDVENQFYHCFGCKEHGDIFSFVQKMDHLDFKEALEFLARKAGVTLSRRGRGAPSGEKTALYDAQERAAEYYHGILREDPRGAPARRYLEGRGIEPAMWKKFRLGYAPGEWDGLLRHLGGGSTGRRMEPEVLEKAGLVRARPGGGGYYDYFRGRLMFPISDPQKRVIGFGARILDGPAVDGRPPAGREGSADQRPEPKYLNTPKTPIFDKGQVLYGLSLARPAVLEQERIAVMEGYTDVIMAHQNGMEEAVASLGTAFTAENARRLRRLVSRVDLIFDGDAAGQSATERSLVLLLAEELEVWIYTLPDGTDPCETLLQLGGQEFSRRVREHSVDIFEFKYRRTVDQAESGGGGPAAVARAVDEVLSLLVRLPNVVSRQLQLRKLAEKLELDEMDLEERLRLMVRGRYQGNRARTRVADGPDSPHNKNLVPRVGDVLLECLVAEPESARDRFRQFSAFARELQVWDEVFSRVSGLLPLASAMERQLETGGLNVKALLAELEHEEARGALMRILARLNSGPGAELSDHGEIWKSCLREINRKWLERRSHDLEAATAEARQSGDQSSYRSLQQEHHEILRKLKSPGTVMVLAGLDPGERNRISKN